MSYTIQGLVARTGAFPPSLPVELERVQLQDGFDFVPLTSKVREAHKISFCPLTDEGSKLLPQSLLQLCERLSSSGEVAYIEAEFFGGAGTQAHAFFVQGKAVDPPVVGPTAINAALARLGAKRGAAADEFETVGLGAHRDTDLWVTPNPSFKRDA